MSTRGMVIIGGGETGASAARTLREEGWQGPITLIGQENLAPYERPPLSKGALALGSEAAPAFILKEQTLEELSITWVREARAVKIDRDRHIVQLADGQEIAYDKLLLATGASPRKLTLEGSNTTSVMELRTFADAERLRSKLEAGRQLVVIGAGFIGLEVAASARERGCQVTVLEVGHRILMRGVPLGIAQAVEARHREAGVNFQLGVGIERIESASGEQRITLANGQELRCDAIIAGIGAIPETSLAAACGLDVGNGILVNDRLATSDPTIYAAGDCCAFPHGVYGGTRIRLEAWRNAQEGGAHAARNMLGADQPYEAIPWFWSDQYEQTLQVIGLPDASTLTVQRHTEDESLFFFHLDDEHRLAAASGIGAGIAKEIKLAEMLIVKRAVLDPVVLAAPGLKLKALLKELS
ncbi:NAD(P)/FAD-dependent oxidoreductase [Paenibacillus roseipurpureus]|uniref:FAD-dependent oxidoreductase n=1 Tax=Paenibacillus roseopurpureus TaxID=2918901 RepID=A0AA96RL77_9BACL|nr:FAD-dependent oxidoreductase [Paenibacillus sp. MBLB1832]WNR42847.1 FAD-dependent oxidoreductase [Paenibacillus sp. MBLB1832]